MIEMKRKYKSLKKSHKYSEEELEKIAEKLRVDWFFQILQSHFPNTVSVRENMIVFNIQFPNKEGDGSTIYEADIDPAEYANYEGINKSLTMFVSYLFPYCGLI